MKYIWYYKLNLKHTKIALKVKVKCHQLPTTSSVHLGTYSYQVTSISEQ